MQRGSWRRQRFPFVAVAVAVAVTVALAGIAPDSARGQPACLPPPADLIAWVAAEDSPRELTGRLGGIPYYEGDYGPGYLGRAFDIPGRCCFGWWEKTRDPIPLPDLTVEAWIQGGGPGQFLGVIGSGGDGVFHFLVHPEGNLLFMREWGVAEILSPPVLFDAEWHHVAATRQGSLVTFYFDGRAVGTGSQAAPDAVLRELSVGFVQPGGGGQFLGRIDEFGLYSRALAPQEIGAIHAAGRAGKCLVDAAVEFAGLADRVLAGADLPVTLAVTNQGSATMRDLVLVAPVPDGTALQDALATRGVVTVRETELRWTLDELAPAEQVTLRYVLATPGTRGFLRLEARLTSGSPDLNVANDGASGITELLGPCEPPPADLAAWWGLENSSYERVTASLATGVEGWVSGNDLLYADGRVGRALNHGGGFNPLVTTNRFGVSPDRYTVELWFRRDRTDVLNLMGLEFGALVAFLPGDTLAISTNGVLSARVLDPFGEILGRVGGSTPIRDTEWHHVALTRNGTRVALFLDGAGIGSGDLPLPAQASDRLALGFPGAISGAEDEVGLYRRPLEPAEIAALAAAGGAGKCYRDVGLRFAAPILHGRTGEVFRVSLVVTNLGASSAPGAVVTALVPADLEVVRTSADPGTTGVQGGTVRADLGDLGAGSVAAVAIDARGARRGMWELGAGIAHGGGDLSSANDHDTTAVVLHERCAPPAEGLLAWWPANGTPADALGRSDGVRERDLYQPGFAGQAFDFSQGTTVRVGNPAELHLRDLTLEAWVRATMPPFSPGATVGNAVFFGGGKGSYVWGVDVFGQMFFGRIDASLVTSPILVWDDAWHHLAVTRSGPTTTFYRDGMAIGTAELPVEFVHDVGFALGGPAEGNTDLYSPAALIDELAVYGRALAAEEILRLADAHEGGKCREDLALELVAGAERGPVGEDAVVAFRVHNWGFGPASSVIATSSVPATVELLGVEVSQGTAASGPRGVTASLGAIPGEGAATVTIRFRPLAVGPVEFGLGVTRDESDLAPANNHRTAAFEAVALTVSVPDVVGLNEGASTNQAVIDVSLSVPSAHVISVRYAVAGDTAKAGEDFVPDAGVVEFPPGTVVRSLPLRFLDDLVDEDDEVLRVRLSEPIGAGLGTNECRVTLRGGDKVPLLFAGNEIVAEGSDTNTVARIAVFLEGRSEREVSVAFATLDLSAVRDRDYRPATGRVTFPPGATRATVEFRLLGNGVPERPRSFAVQLSNPINATLADGTGVVTIVDDDSNVADPDLPVAYRWDPVPGVPAVGSPFPVAVAALDAAGGVLAGYTGSVTLGAEPADRPSPLVFSELDLRSADRVELVNASSNAVELTGWSVVLYDGRTWPAPAVAFQFPSGTVLAGTNRVQIREGGVAPGQFPAFNLGTFLIWADSGAGVLGRVADAAAVLLLDPAGRPRDFVAVNGANPRLVAEPMTIPEWLWGDAPLPLPPAQRVYRRTGDRNQHGSADWIVAVPSSEPAPGLALPFAGLDPLPIVPTEVTFDDGLWQGLLTPGAFASEVVLIAEDARGRRGISAPFPMSALDDLTVRFASAAGPATVGDRFTYRVVVTNSGPAPSQAVRLRLDRTPDFEATNIVGVVTSHGTVAVATNATGGVVMQADLGRLEAGATAEVAVTVTVTAPVALPPITSATAAFPQWVARAVVDRIEPELNTANNRASDRREVASPALDASPFGLVGWWTADAPETGRIVGPAPVAVGGATPGPGRVGSGFRLDGLDDGWEVPHSEAFQPGADGNFSVELWFRSPANDIARSRVLVSKRDAGGAGYEVVLVDGQPGVVLQPAGVRPVSGDGPFRFTVSNLADLRDGTWHHLAVVLAASPSGRETALRLDGAIVGRWAPVPQGSLANTAPVRFGFAPGREGERWLGELDEISLYRRALTAEEVTWIVAAGGNGKEAPPAAPDLDTDTDGLPDSWEVRFGFDPRAAGEAVGDADGDGFVNLDEYRAGTSPRDPLSRLRFDRIEIADGQVVLRFTTVAGRRYRLEEQQALLGSEWKVAGELDATAEGPETLRVPLGVRGFLRLSVTWPAASP
jgi:hypothetical protein